MSNRISELVDKIAKLEGSFTELQNQNTTMSRDNVVRGHLSGLKFRNERAADVAFKEIISQLEQGEEMRTKLK